MRKFLFLLLLCFICNCGFAANLIPLDKIIVVVNGSVITQNELNQAIIAAKQQLASSNTPLPEEQKLRNQVLNSMILHNVQLQKAKFMGIKISDSELNAAIQDIAKRNKMTISQLKHAIESQGQDYAQYRKQIREQMQISRLQQQAIGRDINVSDQETTEFLHSYKHERQPNAEYHIEDILVPLSSTPGPAEIQKAKQAANEILAKIRKGTNFRQLAAAQSGGRQALQGGDLGWRKLPEMPDIFANAAKNMKTGQVAGPLRAPNGFHIIRVAGIRASKQKLTRNNVRELIYRRKFEEKLQIWLKTLRDSAYVKFK